MKKLLFSILVLGAVSCGPTAEEKAKMEQATQDSLKAAEDMQKAAEELAISQAAADSVAMDTLATTDSIK
jgi:hypothetical protein